MSETRKIADVCALFDIASTSASSLSVCARVASGARYSSGLRIALATPGRVRLDVRYTTN